MSGGTAGKADWQNSRAQGHPARESMKNERSRGSGFASPSCEFQTTGAARDRVLAFAWSDYSHVVGIAKVRSQPGPQNSNLHEQPCRRIIKSGEQPDREIGKI